LTAGNYSSAETALYNTELNCDESSQSCADIVSLTVAAPA
jgi:hypothetical protein